MKVRNASLSDAMQILELYAPYVETTAVTFEYTVPTIDEFRKRMETTMARFPYLVAVEGTETVGYAYAGPFKSRAAYDHCVETSVYVRMGMHGRGIGTALYAELEHQLRQQGILNANACISWTEQPDQYLTHESADFHSRRGYTRCAHFHNCGYKFGRWYDMIWMEKMLGEHISDE